MNTGSELQFPPNISIFCLVFRMYFDGVPPTIISVNEQEPILVDFLPEWAHPVPCRPVYYGVPVQALISENPALDWSMVVRQLDADGYYVQV